MSGTLYVINPNSNVVVTAGIDAALQPLRRADGPPIECLTLAEGPRGVQSERDVASVLLPLERLALSLENSAAGVIIACFSDPGLPLLRESLSCPVFGIAECAAMHAMTLGQNFGVIAILDASIPRHMRYWAGLGLLPRLAGEKAIGLEVAQLIDADLTFNRMVVAGQHLISAKGADVIVMGCAGMAAYRAPLEEALGVPVVEPSQAATAFALGALTLGWTRKPGLGRS